MRERSSGGCRRYVQSLDEGMCSGVWLPECPNRACLVNFVIVSKAVLSLVLGFLGIARRANLSFIADDDDLVLVLGVNRVNHIHQRNQ